MSALTTRIAGATGAATLMTTHDLSRALELGTRTFVIGAGRIIADLSRDRPSSVSIDPLSDLVGGTPFGTRHHDRRALPVPAPPH